MLRASSGKSLTAFNDVPSHFTRFIYISSDKKSKRYSGELVSYAGTFAKRKEIGVLSHQPYGLFV